MKTSTVTRSWSLLGKVQTLLRPGRLDGTAPDASSLPAPGQSQAPASQGNIRIRCSLATRLASLGVHLIRP